MGNRFMNALGMLVLLVVLGCSGGENLDTDAEVPDASAEDPEADVAALSCDQLQARASEDVLQVVAANLGCEEDSDCTVTGVNGACFDNCSRGIRADAEAVFQEAIARAEEQWCAQGRDCDLIIPPCVPPGEARCIENVCGEAP